MREKESRTLQREVLARNGNVGKRMSDRSLPVDLSARNKIVGTESMTSIDESPSTGTENLKERLIRSREPVNRDGRKRIENLEENEGKDEVIIEGLIISAGSLIIQTINDLSSELVSVNQELIRERDRSESREFEIDRLKSMIRASSGDTREYRRRIKEIQEFTQRMSRETRLLTSIRKNFNHESNLAIDEERISCLRTLMNELRVKLRNDREALFTGGNEWCLIYVKKIEELKAFTENLSLQVEAASSSLKFGTCIELANVPEYRKEIIETEQLFKRVAYELSSLATMPVKIGPRIGIESCTSYTRRIRSLEKLVGNSITIIGKLLVWSRRNEGSEKVDEISNDSRYRKSIESLEDLVRKLIFGIKQLEMVVAAGDGTYLLEKIRHLEISLKRLKTAMGKKEEEKSSLILELTGAKIAYGEKSEELEKIQKKYEKVASRMKKRGEMVDYEEKMRIVLRELEESRTEGKALRNEVNQLKQEAEGITSDRSRLMEEVEKIRGIAEVRDEEIRKITKERRNREKVLTKETIEVRTKLTSAEAEIKCLKKEISDLREDKQLGDKEASAELKNLKSLLKSAKESLESKNHECTNFKSNINELNINKTKVEQELSCMQTQNEILTGSLNSEIEKHTKTQKDFKKLATDFRLLNEDLARAEMEKSNLQKSLEETERDRNRLRTEFDDCHRRNVSLRSESSSMKARLKELEHELEVAGGKNREFEEQVKKINEQRKDQALRLASLSRVNEKLNDDLDGLRLEKLNMAGALSELEYNFDSARNALEAKKQEAASVDEKLKLTLIDLEKLRESESGARLEVEKLRETTMKLSESIDVANSAKARVEESLEAMENDFRALEHKMSILKTERDALARDSSELNERVEELTKEITALHNATKKNVDERSELVVEHESALATFRKKLSEFEEERARLASDLSSLRDENAALKRDYEEIISENEKMQVHGKRNEMDQLIDENEALKIQLSKLRIFISEEDREIAKNEMEKLCTELVKIRTENCSLKKLRNRRRFLEELSPRDSWKLEEELRACRSEKESLRKNLEFARNKIAMNEEISKESETEINMLKGSIEGLKERYKLSRREFEDARLRNEKLDSEMSELRKYLEAMSTENLELKRELQNLNHESGIRNDENSRIEKTLAKLEGELVALKDELAKLRAENLSLSAQLEVKNADSRRLETENSSLRDELEASRCARTSALEETNELRTEREKLVTLRGTLENKLIDAQREISKYVQAAGKLNDFENKLKTVLKSYIITKKLLRSANEEIARLRLFANPRFQTFKCDDKIRAT